jgi:hypothetical protein
VVEAVARDSRYRRNDMIPNATGLWDENPANGKA